jgi:hypothetical protein
MSLSKLKCHTLGTNKWAKSSDMTKSEASFPEVRTIYVEKIGTVSEAVGYYPVSKEAIVKWGKGPRS